MKRTPVTPQKSLCGDSKKCIRSDSPGFSATLAPALFAACNFSAHAQEVKTVFVIAMENHNWTQPANQSTGGIQQIFQNPNAPPSSTASLTAPPGPRSAAGPSTSASRSPTPRPITTSSPPPTAATPTSIPRSRTTSGPRPAATSACSTITIPSLPTVPPTRTPHAAPCGSSDQGRQDVEVLPGGH